MGVAPGTARLSLGAQHRSLGPRSISAWLAWLVILANAAVIVWLWLSGGGISAVHGVGDLWTSIGRITGLLSAYQALIQVLLLSRLPILERLAGFDRLTVWHRLNGKVCLILVLAHVVFITLGYAGMDKFSVPHEVSSLLSNYPGMIAATIGTAFFILVVVTSLVIVRRRLRYETWYIVHLTAYAGIALAWFHQIPTGNELAVNHAAATYWTSLYLATAVVLLLFRLVLPGIGAVWYRLRVDDVIPENPTVVSLRITGRHLDRLAARPGQFFLWRFLARGRWWESHPFSLSAVPDGKSLRITVKGSGDFTREIGDIRPGTPVIAEGPFGVFTAERQQREHVLFIAGGIGITPIRPLLETLSGDLVLLYRVIREQDLVFRRELEDLARKGSIRLHFVLGDHTDPNARHLLSPGHLVELVPDIDQREVYLCGPPAMIDVLQQNVRACSVPARYIHTERFAL